MKIGACNARGPDKSIFGVPAPPSLGQSPKNTLKFYETKWILARFCQIFSRNTNRGVAKNNTAFSMQPTFLAVVTAVPLIYTSFSEPVVIV